MEKKAVRLSVEDFSTAEDRSQIWNLIVTDGHRFPSSFTFNRPNMLDGVAFCICMSGTARIRINSRIYDIDPSTMITILPVHIIEPLERSDDLVLRLLVCSLEMATDARLNVEAVRNAGLFPCIKVSPRQKEVLISMHNVIIKLYERGGEEFMPVLRSMLSTLVLEIEVIYLQGAAIDEARARTRPEELAENFFKLLVANYKDERAPAFYASELCITPKYLAQIVKQSTGETVFAWINKIVMAGAMNMLKTSEMSVLQVSEQMNFPNPSFFGRYFKKHSGMTPLEYKKSL